MHTSPGSTVGMATKEESLALIASCINRAHKETEIVVVVLENMVRSPGPYDSQADSDHLVYRRGRATS